MNMSELLSPILIPVFPIVAGCAVSLLPSRYAGVVPVLSALSCITALILIAIADPSRGTWLRLDTLSSVMVVLVSFLGAVVTRFAVRYLQGDPHRSRFLMWMSFTLASVLVLVCANHLLLLTAAWLTTSLCLHRLLLHHPGRAGAVFAARKKFVFSRLAEIFLLTSVLILHAHYHTWRIDELLAQVAAGDHKGLSMPALFLALCAMLKSAQFPFHSWLPDTMETPTPVSAFMHAGIINGGGFLVLRMSPIFAASPFSLHLLVIVGSITAAFGAIVMLAQPGVKRSLAFSTIAQMGFMMIQCGLGAWGLALLHLVAHSLYKAHAFLHAGSTIGATPRAAVPLSHAALGLGLVASAIMVTVSSNVFHGKAPLANPVPWVFHLILVFAIAYGIARAWSAHQASLLRAALVSLGVIVAALVLHIIAGSLLADYAMHRAPLSLKLWLALVFTGLFFFQAMLWRASAHPWGRTLYIHALNGFYVGTFANRLLGRLWPKRKLS